MRLFFRRKFCLTFSDLHPAAFDAPLRVSSTRAKKSVAQISSENQNNDTLGCLAGCISSTFFSRSREIKEEKDAKKNKQSS